MNIHHHKVIHLIFAILVLTAIGCEAEKEVSSTNPSMIEAEKEAQIMVPLPGAIAQPTDQQQAVPVESIPEPGSPLPTISSASKEDDGYMELDWDSLIPADYRPEAILSKYMDQLAELDDSSPEAMQLYGIIQAELDNAPINESLNGKKVKLPGFIAPLENIDGKVSEFLLVPYFGACIHVPPPPINQTVLVKTRQQDALKAEETNNPFWIKGTLLTEGESTDIGSAGYRIVQAETEEY